MAEPIEAPVDGREQRAEHAHGPDSRAERPPVFATHDEAVAAAQAYAESIRVGIIERERAGGVPWAQLAELGRSGLLSITLPKELGGPGHGARTLAEVIRTIAAVDPAIAQIPQVHFLFPNALWKLGSTEAQRTLADVILSGGRVGNASAERGGQHAQDLRTRLTRADDGTLRLNGRKYYSTGAISAAWIAVTVVADSAVLGANGADGRDGPAPGEERGLLVYVPRDADGVVVGDDWSAIGQRNTVSGTSTFTDVVVDPAFVVDYGSLYERPQTLGARAQLVHAAIEVGIAGGALRDAGWFLREKSRPFFEAVRQGWAERAADDPHTVYEFGQLATRVAAAEALLKEAALVLDETPLLPDDPEVAARASVAVAKAKAFGSETAVEAGSRLFALTGTSAADAKHNLDRHWRNARTHSVHDPVSWKYHHVGAFELSGTLPPNHGQL